MVAVGLAILDDIRDGVVIPGPPSGVPVAPPAPDGSEPLRGARSLTVIRRFLYPDEAARYARSIESFLDGLESFPADRGGPDGAAPALLHIATRLVAVWPQVRARFRLARMWCSLQGKRRTGL